MGVSALPTALPQQENVLLDTHPHWQLGMAANKDPTHALRAPQVSLDFLHGEYVIVSV